MKSTRDIQVILGEHAEYAEIAVAGSARVSAITARTLADAASKAGVAVTEPVLRRLRVIAESFAKQPRSFSKVIATAKDPIDGRDGTLRWEASFDQVTQPLRRRSDLPPSRRPFGSPQPVNHYAGFRYVDVKADEHVATIIPPTAGVDGVDVCGQPIKAPDGRPCEIKVDKSLTVQEDGKVIARIDGTLQLENNTLSISDVLNVPGCVDFTTGSIKVNGSVHVREHVRANFTIEASGDVSVDGLVEAATIKCGGNFHCYRGVTAKGRGQLVIGGSAALGYLNDATARIEKNLTLRKEAIDCLVAVKGDLHAETATIIGGEVEVAGMAVIGTLGSRSNKPTVILPRGKLVVYQGIHQGVILMLPASGAEHAPVQLQAGIRQWLQGALQLGRGADGQWYFTNAQKQVIPLTDVANIQQRAA